jgi:hypothetical protein
MHDARAWLCRFRVRTFAWWRNQRFDKLVPETESLVRAHVATDHTVPQPRLERLIDNAPFARKIRFALFHELAQRRVLGHAAAARVQHPYDCRVLRGCGYQLDLPHSLTAIAAVLFEDPRTCRSKARRKLFAKCCSGAIQMGVCAQPRCLVR